MNYGSVCSGIEAATVAWEPLGWKPSFFSEIDKFPRAILENHYPEIPLHGDFTTIQENDYEPIDLRVGGTPCQSFSVAGLRKGMDDDRGNLALEYLRLVGRLNPRWIVWENVPGVLSSNGGRDFGSFLGALVELGYSFAYRVFDAQYFGVAQRRRRVFVIGYLGDWRYPAAVLFESESLCGHPAPSRENRQENTSDVAGSIRDSGSGTSIFAGNKHTEIAATLETTCHDYSRADNFHTLVSFQSNATADQAAAAGHNIAPTMPACSGGNPAIAFNPTQSAKVRSKGESVEISPTLGTNLGTAVAIQNATRGKSQNGLGISAPNAPMYTLDQGSQHAVAFMENQRGEVRTHDITYPVQCAGGKPGQGYQAALVDMQVRRLTPIECERLQGFPDNYTQIPWRKKSVSDCPIGPRYKALGNSMAVPVMAWIGERIQIADNFKKQTEQEKLYA